MAYRTLRTLSFQQTDGAKTPIGDEVIVKQGDPVPDWVKPYEVSALAAAGVIVDMGEERTDDPYVFAELPPALPNPEVPPTLAGNQVLPALDVDGGDLASLEGEPVAPEVVEDGELSEVPASRPADSASKAVWEDYAESQGIARPEAESMTKKDLIAAVDQRAQS
jgi:hypothetical protein